VRAAKIASLEPSVARRILVGKMVIYSHLSSPIIAFVTASLDVPYTPSIRHTLSNRFLVSAVR